MIEGQAALGVAERVEERRHERDGEEHTDQDADDPPGGERRSETIHDCHLAARRWMRE
jgi:hypothetical protein